MLTTSRREIFAENTDSMQNSAPATTVDTKSFGKQAFDINAQIDNVKNEKTSFTNSYFAAEDEDITVKLFGQNIPLEYINAVETADAENFSNPDLMPSSATMENHFNVKTPSFNTKYNTVPTVNIKLNKKNKIAIVSYVAVVLALVLIISLTAIAVNATMGDVADLQLSIKETMSQIDEMYSDVNLNAESYAAELGLTSSGQANTQYYNSVTTRDMAVYDLPTNWFDQLCQWISNVFGG